MKRKNDRSKLDHDATADTAEREKKREQHAVERQEWEAAEKRQKLLESSLTVAQIDVSQLITSTDEDGNRKEGNEEDFPSD